MVNQAIPHSREWSIEDAEIADQEILCVSADLSEIESSFLVDAESCLGDEEIFFANSFIKKVDKTRYILSHFLLNHLLIASFGPNIKQIRRKDKKPFLAHNLGEFNISHSHSFFVAAFSIMPVGIDIEKIKPIPNLDQMIDLVFHPQESLEISQMNQNDALVAFFRCWTRKEALLKLLGVGLNDDLRTYHVSCQFKAPTPLSINGVKTQKYAIRDLEIPDKSYLSSVAFEAPNADIRFKNLTKESIYSLIDYCKKITLVA